MTWTNPWPRWSNHFLRRDYPFYSHTRSQLDRERGISSSYQGSGLSLPSPSGGVLPLQRPVNTFGVPTQSVGLHRPGYVPSPERPVDTVMQGLGVGPECRCESYDLYMIGAVGNHSRAQTKPTTHFQRYDFDKDRWTLLRNDVCGHRITGFAVATLQDEIWVLGGCVTLEGKEICKKNVFVYCIKSGKWISKEMMKYARADFCAAVVGESLYAIGGRFQRTKQTADSRHASVEMFTKGGKSTPNVNSMNIARSSFACCVVGEIIYVAGGATWIPEDSTVEYYSTGRDEWTCLKIDLPNMRKSFGLVYVNDQLYAVGGDRDGSVIRKCKDRDRWSDAIIHLPKELGSYDVFSLGREIYVLGKVGTDEARFYKFRPADPKPVWEKLTEVTRIPWDGEVRVSLFKNRSCENDQKATVSQ